MSADPSPPSSPSAYAPAMVAGLPGAAGAVAATCGTACAGACAPPVLGLLGLSGGSAALGSWSPWLRPLLFAVSLAALGLAFHRAYRRRPSDSGSGAPRRFRDSRGFVWLMAIVCLGLFGLPYLSRAAGRSEQSQPCDTPCPLRPAKSPPCDG